MRKPFSHRLLHAIALALSSVTMYSVALAMLALIPDPTMSWVFAAAAVLLDGFKYIAWPMAVAHVGSGRLELGVLVMGCAVVLAGVSGWATYDRLHTSMTAAAAQHAAISGQRIADLDAAQADARSRVAALDAEAASVRQQAAELRARMVVTKAADLEASALPRIAGQRDQQVQRIEQASLELTALRGQTAATTTLPSLLTHLLALGFAVALELVPALILTALRAGNGAVTADPVAVTAAAARVTAGQRLPANDSNGELMQELIEISRATPKGKPVSVRNIRDSLRVGTKRAMGLLEQACSLGIVEKTGRGYVATAA